MIDVHRLIGEVAARDGIREHIRAGIAEFNQAVQKTENRAGKLLAQEVKDAAAEIREELQRDIETARVSAREILYEVHRKHNTAIFLRSAVAAISAAAAVFASGFWAGTHFLR